MRIIAFVGMPGAGKTLAAKFLEEKGIQTFRVGDLTEEELKKQGLEVNEENERKVREELRKEFGMDVYAKKVAEKIDKLNADFVVLEGVRSFQEYEYLKNNYNDNFTVISIVTSPRIRHERLGGRKYRGLSKEDCISRDLAELQNLNMGDTIAMGDYFIINDSTKEELKASVEEVLNIVKGKV